MDHPLIPPELFDGRPEVALDRSIEAVLKMMEHPDPHNRRHHDTAFGIGGRILAVARHTCDGPVATRFASIDLVLPGWATGREPGEWYETSLAWLDGPTAQAGFALGTLLKGRDLSVALEDAIWSATNGSPIRNSRYPERFDIALSYRGRFLVLVRFTPAGADIVRFEETIREFSERVPRSRVVPSDR
jgi:hypothetical protein